MDPITPCRRASGGDAGALLSCTGFPGWGGVHLIVPSRGHPAGLALRLQLPDRPAGLLLPALLRQHRDLEPLDPDLRPWARPGDEAWPPAWRHRYLLVCPRRATLPLRISAWQRQGVAGAWIRCCGPLPLAGFRRRFLPAPDAPEARQEPRGHRGAGGALSWR
ncbi:MAG: hypothetical protein ER33_14910 [Cyanobium sp. CACIAM 14]|nr:MAG: hypothetical protein ER33_14910 [Cyanobium sp. CACIAM 14]